MKKSEWMSNSEYRATLDFEQRGTVLAGIIENPHASPSGLLSQIYDIVGDYLERYREDSYTYYIFDHWIVYNPIERYWGVYYKEDCHCEYDARETNQSGDTETFCNYAHPI